MQQTRSREAAQTEGGINKVIYMYLPGQQATSRDPNHSAGRVLCSPASAAIATARLDSGPPRCHRAVQCGRRLMSCPPGLLAAPGPAHRQVDCASGHLTWSHGHGRMRANETWPRSRTGQTCRVKRAACGELGELGRKGADDNTTTTNVDSVTSHSQPHAANRQNSPANIRPLHASDKSLSRRAHGGLTGRGCSYPRPTRHVMHSSFGLPTTPQCNNILHH